MIKEILYATNNPGKVFEISRHLNSYGIKVVSPKDLGIDLDVPETGDSLEKNARLKAQAFSKLAGGRVVLADDTGLEINALHGEPGIHVRRWKDKQTRMEDEDIIAYCLQRMSGVPLKKRGAQFKTILALAIPGEDIEFYQGTLKGIILEQAAVLRVEGFPFESLFFVPEWDMLLGDARQLSVEEKSGMLNHRERSIEIAIPRIKELLDN